MVNLFRSPRPSRRDLILVAVSLWLAISLIPATVSGTLIPTDALSHLILIELVRLILSVALVVAISYGVAMLQTRNRLHAALMGGVMSVIAIPPVFILEWQESAPRSAFIYTAFVVIALVACSVVLYGLAQKNNVQLRDH
jgi:uncharacterized MnhB-related membrane protein